MLQSSVTKDYIALKNRLDNDQEFQQSWAKLNNEKRQYWEKYLQALLLPYKTDSMLNNFVTNRAVTGAFGEALVRALIQKMLPHLRISTGAILRLSDHLYLEERTIDYDKIPQGDLIIWDPSVIPAAIEIGDFAVVSNLAARGVIEVKRTNTAVKKTQEKLKEWQKYLSMVPLHEDEIFMDCAPNILGVVIKHKSSLLEEEPLPNMWDERRVSPVMVRLFKNDYSEDIDGFLALIFFLAHIAKQPQKTYFNKLKQLDSRLTEMENLIHQRWRIGM